MPPRAEELNAFFIVGQHSSWCFSRLQKRTSDSSFLAVVHPAEAAEGDVTAASKQDTVSSSGQRHRRTQAEPDETAKDDEAEASKRFAQSASACLSEAINGLAAGVALMWLLAVPWESAEPDGPKLRPAARW